MLAYNGSITHSEMERMPLSECLRLADDLRKYNKEANGLYR